MRLRLSNPSLLAIAGLLSATAAGTAALAQSVLPIALSAPRTYSLHGSVHSFPRAYASGDLDEDGNTDLVVNNGNSNGAAGLQLLMGDGAGDFIPMAFPNGPAHADSVLIADVNGDGHLDVITLNGSYDDNSGGPCCSYAGEAAVYLGDGQGNFTLNSSQALPNGFAAGVLGDFNGDGKVDLAVLVQSYLPEQSPSVVTMFMNHGDGSFTQGESLAIPAMIAITAGDFNGDGNLDLAVAGDLQTPYCDSHAAIRTFYGNGQGSFPKRSTYWLDSCPTSLTSADFNLDGRTDLLVGLQARNAPTARPRIATLLAKKVGYYWSSAISVPNSPYSLALADLNGDGRLDLATTWAGATDLHTFVGLGNGNFGNHQSFPGGVNAWGSLMAVSLTRTSMPSIFYGSNGPFLYALINGSQYPKIPLAATR